jgi:hypothetical protein
MEEYYFVEINKYGNNVSLRIHKEGSPGYRHGACHEIFGSNKLLKNGDKIFIVSIFDSNGSNSLCRAFLEEEYARNFLRKWCSNMNIFPDIEKDKYIKISADKSIREEKEFTLVFEKEKEEFTLVFGEARIGDYPFQTNQRDIRSRFDHFNNENFTDKYGNTHFFGYKEKKRNRKNRKLNMDGNTNVRIVDDYENLFGL